MIVFFIFLCESRLTTCARDKVGGILVRISLKPVGRRTIWLEFEKEVEYEGVPAYRFIVPPAVFDPKIPENDGFCNPTDKKFFESQNETDDCFPEGLLEISKCLRSQPPIMISLPNFNFAPEEVRQSVKGLNSTDPERDIILVDIEPRLGAVLRAHRRFQVNIEMWKG
ncbi:unnamed protein product, partial [Haemonchus placei]|uniref:Uncharacterized protein n=1 Tax=Haemonchus placei TaxID=6290 RepID=A0A0N4VXV1_HAEPC